MASNNNDNSGMAAGFGLVVAVIGAMAIMAFFVFVFIAFVLTIVCFCAWNRPVTIGRWTLLPDAARSFVKRGLAGAFLLPAFCIFLELFFDIRINGEYLTHIIVGGYVLGSLGLEILWAEDGNEASSHQTVIPPSQQIAPPPREAEPPARPFRFASWDDEDGR